MNSAVKVPVAHFRRRPCLPFQWAWWWVEALLVVSLLASMGVGARTIQQQQQQQEFPIAAEEDNYTFRSDGTYSFSYDTGSGEHQSFRMEARDATGRVSGRYGYIDPDGVLRITQYQADSTGYRANMLIYRKVTSPPAEPLLVGPLPRAVPEPDPELAPRNAPSGSPSRPIGPVTFFDPDKPVLIIGPLPKPLQPSRGDDSDVPDFAFGTDFDSSQGISLTPPSQDVSQDLLIRNVPVDPPPDSQNGVLQTFLQENLNNILRVPIPGIFISPNFRGNQDISFNNVVGAQDNVSFPSSDANLFDLGRISDGLLQGPEVILNSSPRNINQVQLPTRRNLTTPANFTEERVARTPAVNNVNITAGSDPRTPPSLHTAFDVFIKLVNYTPSINSTQERQNGTLVPPTAKNDTSTPPPMLKRSNATALPFPINSTLTPPYEEVSRVKMTKSDTDRSPSVAVPINLPTVPSVPLAAPPPLPLTYLPADNTKIPKPSFFFGQLPNY